MYTQMMTFIAVVEEQGFTNAAKRLSITPTAVSKQIMQLEAHLGQQLLERHTRKVALTEIGERFYEHCKRLEQEMAAAMSFIHAQKVEPQGELRILVAVFFAQLFLVKHLVEFHQRYPELRLRVEIADRIPDMEREPYDLLLGFRASLPQIPDYLRQKQLLFTNMVLCASPQYLQKHGVPKVPQDLRHHQMINHPIREPMHVVQFKDGTQIYMDPPQIVVNSMDALVSLCCDGAGLLMVAELQVESLLQEKKLIQVLVDYPMEEISINVFYRYTQYEQPKVRHFIDFLLEKIKGHQK